LTVKLRLLVAVPPGVVTVIGPAVVPTGTIALIFVDEATVKDALTPLNLTEVAPVKRVPEIETELPTRALVGEKDVIVGAAGAETVTVKLPPLAAVPPGVVTEIGPVVAADGTVALIWVAEVTVKVALAPLKLTAVAPVKAVPVIVTEAPAAPLAGEKDVIVGADTVVPPQEGNLNEPMRVCQLSWPSVVGWFA
jgi:hypothetical protein